MTEAAPQTSTPQGPSGLGASARASILWGGGFTLLRDVAQFGVMIILVRLLTPADYGTAALVQSIVGVFSVISYGTFSTHTLQHRNPNEIDWQAHFTAAAVLNTAIATLVLALAFGLSFMDRYRAAALPLAALAVVFLIEIPGTLRHRMLEVHHDWKRFRLMLIIGTILGLGVGLAVGLMGGGVWALIVQIPMLGVPAAIDLFVTARFKPDWSWSWARYREAALFGFSRAGAGFLGRGRVLAEQGLLAAALDFATLGLFSRAIGLSTLIAGRIGSVAMTSLYPIVTRVEAGSAQFRRYAGLVLGGVCWATAAGAGLLGVVASDIILLLYGDRWSAVIALLPLAAISVGFGGVLAVASSLLLASGEARTSLLIDLFATCSGVALAFALLPQGIQVYLTGLAALSVVMIALGIGLLWWKNAIALAGVAAALGPAIVAVAVAVVAVLAARRCLGTSVYVAARLAIDTSIFGFAYLTALRLVFPRPLADLVAVAPGSARLAKFLRLCRDPAAPHAAA